MNKFGVEHRAISVSLVTGLSSLLSIIFQLISVPVCLHFWGAEKYGVWLAIFTVSTMFRTIDGGFINFVGNRLNLLYHQDQVELHRVLASSVIGVAVLGIVQISLVLFAAFGGGFSWLLGNDSSMAVHAESKALIILVLAWVLAGSYIGIVHRLLIPAGLMYQAAWWSMAYQASLFVALIVSAVGQLSLLSACIVIAAAQSFVFITSALYIKRKLPDYYPWWKSMDWKTGKKNLFESWVFMFSGVLQQTSTSGVVLLVSSLFGASLIPVFTTVRTMANLWNNVTATLTSPLLPDVIRYHATQQTDKLLAVVQAHLWLIGGLVNVGVLIAYPFMLFAYGYWTKGQLLLDRPLLATLLVAVVLSNASALFNMYLSGINHTGAVISLSILRVIFTFGIGIAFSRFGLFGIGIGIAAAEFICFVVAAFILFPSALKMECGEFHWPRLEWVGFGLGCVVLFLFATIRNDNFPIALYCIAIIGLAISIYMGWQQLDNEVKRRFVLLIHKYN